MQSTSDIESRMFYDFPSVTKSVEFLISQFELNFRDERQGQTSFTYDLRALYAYIDKHPELFVLVYSETTKSYVPYGKQWIKSKVHEILTK